MDIHFVAIIKKYLHFMKITTKIIKTFNFCDLNNILLTISDCVLEEVKTVNRQRKTGHAYNEMNVCPRIQIISVTSGHNGEVGLATDKLSCSFD